MSLTAERLREVLDYDPETGVFRWRKLRHRPAKDVGSIAGCPKGDGYWVIMVDRRRYRAHRLAWLYMTGAWPKLDIDHKNGIEDDNRFVNLREATQMQNQRNCRRHRHNTSGFKGVRRRGARWEACIKHAGRVLYLGIFEAPADAHAAYCRAAIEIDPEFARFA